MKRVRTQTDLRQVLKHYRVRGFDDGRAGLPAKSTNLVYQQAWKRGAEARHRDEGSVA